MSALLNYSISTSIEEELLQHPSWLGNVSGLKAEKLLRGHRPYLYVLRTGEHEGDYYVTFVMSDASIKHQPFVITTSPQGWYVENGGGYGPFIHSSIDDIMHAIMHCSKGECTPFVL